MTTKTSATEAPEASTDSAKTPKISPDYSVYAVVPKGRGTRIGARLGVVFNHKSGNGFTMYLDAQPIPNANQQVELVAYPPKPPSR